MKARPSVLAFSALCLAITVMVLKSSTLPGFYKFSQPSDSAKYGSSWLHDRNYKSYALSFNGTIRGGLSSKAVPEQARSLAEDYKRLIYPALNEMIKESGFLPSQANEYPRLRTYLAEHPKWSAGASYRLDGTMIARATYANKPPSAAHDPWAFYAFIPHQNSHKGIIIITGWDDGKVTFDPLETCYEGTSHTSVGQHLITLPPGAAGIPPETKHVEEVVGRRFFEQQSSLIKDCLT